MYHVRHRSAFCRLKRRLIEILKRLQTVHSAVSCRLLASPNGLTEPVRHTVILPRRLSSLMPSGSFRNDRPRRHGHCWTYVVIEPRAFRARPVPCSPTRIGGSGSERSGTCITVISGSAYTVPLISTCRPEYYQDARPTWPCRRAAIQYFFINACDCVSGL